MKIFKKIIAAVAAAAVALAVLPASAFAAEDWMAKVIQPDKEYSFTLPDNTSETVDYKIDMKFPEYLVLDVSSTADETRFDWCSETNDQVILITINPQRVLRLVILILLILI